MSSRRKQMKTSSLKHGGMGSISDMFKKQNESKKNRSNSSVEPNEKSIIHIGSSDDESDSNVGDCPGPGADRVSTFDACTCTRTTTVDDERNLSNKTKSTDGIKMKRRFEACVPPSRSSLSLKRKNPVSVSELEADCDSFGEDRDIKVKVEVHSTSEDQEVEVLSDANGESNSFENKAEKDLVEWESAVQKGEEFDVEVPVTGGDYRDPYYKRNFETILKTIVKDDNVSDLFDHADNSFFNSYFSLSEQAKQLYVRLFGRKFQWIPSSKIAYPEIGENLTPYLKELKDSQLIHDEDSLTDLGDVLETLSASDIKLMAKNYHLAPSVTQKKHIIQEMLKLCHRSTVSSMFGSKGGVSASMLKKSKTMVHGAYKLQQEPRRVFIRVMMLFSLVNTTGDDDSANGGQGQLFQMLMVNMGKVVYPSYEINRKHRVFKTREDVIRFEHALQLESDLLHAVGKGNWTGAYGSYCMVSKQLELLQKDKEVTAWNKNLPDFLRSFTATSVLCRLMSQGIEILQRRKEYDSAVTLIKKLLDQELYCLTHRGYWWERLALDLDVHLKEPHQSLEAVGSGLEDQHVIGGHRLALFQRAESICDRTKLKLKHRISEFHHDPIRELPKVFIEGRILHQGVTSAGPRFLTEGSYANGNAQEMTVCGVEEFVLEHYKNKGYPSGLHVEGMIVTSLFGLFFWDILFMPIPDAFHSIYQAQPLDLYSTSSFYNNRTDAIDARLEQLETSSCQALNDMMEETWNKEHGKSCVGVNWERLGSIDDLKGLVQCIGGKVLSGILGRYARCPRHTRSGFPDLTMWNVNTGAWKICEVKGPGDKLSHKQILWLDYLLGLGVDAEVCHVKAVAAKKLRPNM